jgi:hypothetical protein
MSDVPSFDLWALQERCKAQVTQLYDVWRIYITWYTVFLTFNVGALVFYSNLMESFSGGVSHRVLVGLFFLLQNTCAVITSIRMASFSQISYESLHAVLDALSKVMPEPRASLELLTSQRPLIPRAFMVLGAWFNVSGPVALGIIWAWLTMCPAAAPGQ